MRRYGQNPYTGYDSSRMPFLYRGEMPKYINPMFWVVVVKGKARSFTYLKDNGSFKSSGLEITWYSGQNSALDTRNISKGHDVGNVKVRRDDKDVVYIITFAFVYNVFHNGKRIVTGQ